ncbi:alpha/beta hydrolase family protein [Lignipirellula cremea]|uniref:Uncharacterized protein n=1 Tax=Lignipirellula cremea TaxID=2528010 RepID=A0A518DWH5_9BACT|nr:acetylxylan esterase [Lignipirellula cremea]QDU96190.1 hypothetical protein Pla8534_40090 [Lignipirellula cremea]
MPPTRRTFLGLTAATVAASACGERSLTAAPQHSEATATYLQGIYAETDRKHTFDPAAPGGFARWQADARPELRRLLGLEEMARHAADHQPAVKLEAPEDRDDYTLQAGRIETEPNVSIPFWLLRPRGDGPFPLAVLPHGHDRDGHNTCAGVYRDEAHRTTSLAQDRDVGVQAVRRGFLTIAPATRGLATAAAGTPDVFDRHGGRDCRSHFMHCLLAGRTAVGERVWDMSRIIDWAIALPEVDRRNVLMMGNSGGGVVTMYAAACEERIRIAVASCSFSVLTSKTGRIYHCDCCAIPGIMRWGELYDVCGLAAPRYLLAVNGRHDGLHTTEDIERSAQRVRQIYQAAGVPDHFAHRWGPKGHQFYSDLMWPFVMQALQK